MRAYVLNNINNSFAGKNVYRFNCGERTTSWPMQDGAFLGSVGAWNLLFRIGMQPEYLPPGAITDPADGDILFAVAEDAELDGVVRETIDRWMAKGGTVIAGGSLHAWKWLLPAGSVVEQVRCEFPYAALAWKFDDASPEIIAPPQWSYSGLTANAKGDLQISGRLLAVRGERQTPARAFTTPLENAPALIRHKNFIFLNGSPFAAFQAWLQGQEDLSPWLQWRHRLFWLDEFVVYLLKVINEYGRLKQKIVPRKVAGLPETVVVFRHDLDNSRDVSYLQAETSAGLPAVHAVLRDTNTDFWLKALSKTPGHEVGFHYTTARYNRWLEWFRSKAGLSKRTYRQDRDKITGDGLLKQVRWAKRRGIGVATIHRHLPFLIYPEWVDALHCLFENEPQVLGGSSLFRAQVLRWGVEHADGARGTYGEYPDPQFPYWFPCKLAHAGLGGVSLKGWETASLMETEPEFFKQILDYRVPGILQKIITVNYHPAHAQRPTFCRGGSLVWWKEILRIVNERAIQVKTLQEIYTIMDNASV